MRSALLSALGFAAAAGVAALVLRPLPVALAAAFALASLAAVMAALALDSSDRKDPS